MIRKRRVAQAFTFTLTLKENFSFFPGKDYGSSAECVGRFQELEVWGSTGLTKK